MKVNRLETHDRLLHFKKDQSNIIQQGAEDCLKRNNISLGLQERSDYIYIFAHPRTSDDGFSKRLLWQARLTKPYPQENSYLFRAQSKTDMMEVCWLLPPHEMWNQYAKGNVTEHEIVRWSINQYRHNLEELAQPDPQDLPDHIARNIYIAVATEIHQDRMMKKLWTKPNKEII